MLCSSRAHVVHHAFDVFQHVAAAHLEQVQLAQAGGVSGGAQVSSASIQSCMALRWSSQVSSSMCSDRRASSSDDQFKACAGLEQLGLPVVKLAREFAAQSR